MTSFFICVDLLKMLCGVNVQSPFTSVAGFCQVFSRRISTGWPGQKEKAMVITAAGLALGAGERRLPILSLP
jgi:hypothetical protein